MTSDSPRQKVKVTKEYIEETWKYINELENKLQTLEKLVDEWLPEIGMTMTFRDMFYVILGQPNPDWCGERKLTKVELDWIYDSSNDTVKTEENKDDSE